MADLVKVQEIVEDMNKKLTGLCVSVGKINERCVAREKIIHGHSVTLYGTNGTGGVVARQNNVLDSLKAIEKNTDTAQQWKQRIIAPIIVALVVAAVFGIFTTFFMVRYEQQRKHESPELRGRSDVRSNTSP